MLSSTLFVHYSFKLDLIGSRRVMTLLWFPLSARRRAAVLTVGISQMTVFAVLCFKGNCFPNMSLLMLGLQTNRQGQHYSEQSRDPPNSSLSLKQKSDHSSTAAVVLNRALLYLCIAWSEQCTYTHLPVYTLAHTHTRTCIRMQTGHRGVSACPCPLLHFFFFSTYFTFFFLGS